MPPAAPSGRRGIAGCVHQYRDCREEKHYPYADPADSARLIQVKDKGPDLLRRALSRAPVDVVATGDYQPAEPRSEMSRRLLEVCLELGFPVSVPERSPLVLRHLDLLQAIDERAAAVVLLHTVSTPDSRYNDRVCQIERLAPPAVKRLEAMERIAREGFLAGTCMMPIPPCLFDEDFDLQYVVRWTADHGGQYVRPAV